MFYSYMIYFGPNVFSVVLFKEEEEEEVQYTEDEESIIAYLKEDEPLPTTFLEKLVSDWWKREPFK